MRAVVHVILAALSASAIAAQPASLDASIRAFLEADSPRAARGPASRIIASGAAFDDVASRLKDGRTYAKRGSGRVAMPTTVDGVALDNVVEIPEGYDPARRWPVRVSLHGGVGREPPGPGGEPGRPLANRIPGSGEIVIHPRAWAATEWWKASQVENVLRLLERVKREYNVDESRVYVTGISDGGTGVYFFGMREATPWAACLPLNGHPSVLANPDVGADGQLHAGNLVNCPLYIVNGGRDRLYPAASVAPMVEMLRRGNVPLVWQVHPDAGHDVSWWPQERPRYEAFLAGHARVPHPATVSWETERTDRYNRFRWLVIERLGARPSDVALPDVNTFQPAASVDVALYRRTRPSGRADVVRSGNSFEARTRGVSALTLLLSADAIDFTKPVRVAVNGRVSHDAVVKKDVATLLEWAARDNDRTMLYAAALRIVVP